MSTSQCKRGLNRQPANGRIRPRRTPHPLHRIAEVRRQQRVSSRVLASRMNTTVAVVDRQQERTCDLLLSDLYKWQAALEVPIADLLIEPGPGLSPCIRRRAGLVKAMKTAKLMERYMKGVATRLLVKQLIDQLTDLMPELKHVDAWPKVGKRRTADEIAPLEEHLIPESLVDGV
jgi:hypothetical protein